jgi:hypothetical protein
MKQLIVLLLTVLVISCDDDGALNSNPLQTSGEIIEIRRIDTGVYFKAKINNSSSREVSLWFIGSDTCKIGQKVILK